MGIGRTHSIKKTLAQVLLLLVPSMVFACFILLRLNNFYTILKNDWLMQGLYFGLGAFAALLLFSFRFRFITSTAAVFLINYLIYVSFQNINISEFDSFYLSVKYYIFIILFSTGWIVGYAFSRSKYLTIIWSALFLVIELVLISKTTDITANAILNGIVPALVYAFYIIYTAELIRNLNEDETRFTWFITRRLALFALILLLLFTMLLSLFKGSFTAIEKDWGGGKAQNNKEKGKDNSESMTKKGKSGGVENKDQSKLAGSLSKDKQLIFVARLDNFFPNSKTPNPLYFTSHYYTKFDTATQTFEVDDNMPYNDLFKPDPSKIPLYFKKTDSDIIKKSLATINRKVVSADVYKVLLSPESYLAPSTAFYCQPISIPKEFKDQYKSAYSAKMWVSELNSAYFIYNPAGNKDLERFQEMRFERLREIDNIEGPDAAFMKYFTYMPRNEEYTKIGTLAKEITRNKQLPIDKIIAIRDYFLSKDEFNQPLFKYSDNPGIPGLPSANKLTYFLFENRKGYCAYFAGATLFMLRSLGIPSRVAVGYSVTDRSSKNPGWYWFYEDQAHAWVQVYFQGYGWIDFDTTIPDVNTQQAKQPDGTPPTEVPATYLVVDGEVVATDTIKKQLTISSKKILYHDSEFVSVNNQEMLTDVSLASISSDTGEVKLKHLLKGTHVTAVSHAEALKTMYTKTNDSLVSIINRLTKPIPIDEVKIIQKEDKKKKDEEKNSKAQEPINWLKVLYTGLWTLLGLGLLALMSPYFIWLWLNGKARHRGGPANAYQVFRASMYFVNQMGYPYKQVSNEELAYQLDSSFGTQLQQFNRVYQKVKYSKVPLNESEKVLLQTFYRPFIAAVKQKLGLGYRFKKFLNINHTITYFSKPKLNA